MHILKISPFSAYKIAENATKPVEQLQNNIIWGKSIEVDGRVKREVILHQQFEVKDIYKMVGNIYFTLQKMVIQK